MGGGATPKELLDLVDWRRRVGDLYRTDGDDAVVEFRRRRDELMRGHPQSPLPTPDRSAFSGLDYFPPDSTYRLECRMEATESSESDEEVVIETGGPDGDIRYRRAGVLRFDLKQTACRLTVFSLIGYAGGLFLPFRDATSGHQTYGGGRYLFDTIKSHLPSLSFPEDEPGKLTIDFNLAYNPSCAYDPHWACPLAPRENWLPVPIEAGEMVYEAP